MHAYRCIAAKGMAPYFFDNSPAQPGKVEFFVKFTYQPGVLSVHCAITGELYAESLPGQLDVLNESAFLARTDVAAADQPSTELSTAP